MRLLLFLATLGSNICSAASVADVNIVYAKIIHANHIRMSFNISVVADSNVNASCFNGHITINHGLVVFAKSRSELAIIIGHEIAHCLHGDLRSTHRNEYRADKHGVLLAARSGYNVCAGVDIIRRFHDKTTKTHPASADRYNSVKCK